MCNWSDSVNVAQAARKICVACWQVNNAFVPIHSCTGILKWVVVPTFRLLPYITFLPTLNSRRQRRAFGKTRRFGLAASSRFWKRLVAPSGYRALDPTLCAEVGEKQRLRVSYPN